MNRNGRVGHSGADRTSCREAEGDGAERLREVQNLQTRLAASLPVYARWMEGEEVRT